MVEIWDKFIMSRVGRFWSLINESVAYEEVLFKPKTMYD